jgi:hypothetical protein
MLSSVGTLRLAASSSSAGAGVDTGVAMGARAAA